MDFSLLLVAIDTEHSGDFFARGLYLESVGVGEYRYTDTNIIYYYYDQLCDYKFP